MSPTPITIITGFLGAGKTTILLNLLPQLPRTYRLALLKNEFGDVAVDSQLFDQLASRTETGQERETNGDDENGGGENKTETKKDAISGVKELLNGCICCNLVGQLGDALVQLKREYRPDRIIIETSGSAFPATLAMEVNRLSREGISLSSSSGGAGGVDDEGKERAGFMLDGVISVIDVENWEGYDDTSYTAKLQAKYTDLIIFNKWEGCDERRFDICLDRLGDLDVDTPWVKSDHGKVDKDVLLGIDGALLAKEGSEKMLTNGADHGHNHTHTHDHQSEVEVLSLTLTSTTREIGVDLPSFLDLLQKTSREEVYRIKGIVHFSADRIPQNSDPEIATNATSTTNGSAGGDYILNWAFGRWTFTPISTQSSPDRTTTERSTIARLTFILARYEAAKWLKKLQSGTLPVTGESSNSGPQAELVVERLL